MKSKVTRTYFGGSIQDVRKARDEIREQVIGLLRGINIPLLKRSENYGSN